MKRLHPICDTWALLFAMLFLGACMKVAPKVNGAYTVRNERSTVVHVEAWAHGEALYLRLDSVMPGGSTEIFSTSDRTAGRILPSVVFDDIRFTTVDSTGNTEEIYHGIHDSDWNTTSSADDRMDFEFVVE